MQYKKFCHEHLSTDAQQQQAQQQQQQSLQQQEQQQPHGEADCELGARLIQEYVAIGMVGSELSVLSLFSPQGGSVTVMQATVRWLSKWYQVLVSPQLAFEVITTQYQH